EPAGDGDACRHQQRDEDEGQGGVAAIVGHGALRGDGRSLARLRRDAAQGGTPLIGAVQAPKLRACRSTPSPAPPAATSPTACRSSPTPSPPPARPAASRRSAASSPRPVSGWQAAAGTRPISRRTASATSPATPPSRRTPSLPSPRSPPK